MIRSFAKSCFKSVVSAKEFSDQIRVMNRILKKGDTKMSEYNLTFRELEEGKIYEREGSKLEYRVDGHWIQWSKGTDWVDVDSIRERARFKLKEEKKRYWIWVLLKDGRYLESDDFADNDGVGTSGNKIYFGDYLFKKLEDRYIDV